jgi:branched-chain amino acid transport system substrate-binding protein
MTRIAIAVALALGSQVALAQAVKIAALVELSGPGTTSGTEFRNGIQLAVK